MANEIKFIITVDTEADNQWEKNGIISTENIAYLSRFQNLCEKYGFVPTYLITYEVAVDPASAMIGEWQKQNKAEVGAHLHPWTSPPFFEDYEVDHVYPSELSDRELFAKLEELTWTITNKFGRRPTSYRAGRWGLDDRQIEFLSKMNYLVDCSVTPKVSWKRQIGKKGGGGGPDFRLASVIPTQHEAGSGVILEVPVTIVFTSSFVRENSTLARWFLSLKDGLFKKIVNKLFFRQKWLRIFPNSKTGDWKAIYKSAVRNKLPVLEFMVHSSELMPGGSPYTQDAQSVEFIYDQLEKMFKFFSEQGSPGRTLSDFANKYAK